MKNQQKVEAFENNYRGKQLMNRLKIMAAGAALAAVSGGAFGVNPVMPDLDPLGCAIFQCQRLKVCPDQGIGYLPACAAIVTARRHVFCQENEPLMLIQLFPEDATNSPLWVPGRSSVDKASRRDNIRKTRGIYNPKKLPDIVGASGSAVRDYPARLNVCLVVQPMPADNGTVSLYVRPDFALRPMVDCTMHNISIKRSFIRSVHINGSNASSLARVNEAPVDFALSNADFTAECPETFKMADDVDVTKMAACVSYFEVWGDDTGDDANQKKGFLTYHVLIPRGEAKKCRKSLQLAALKTQFDDHFGIFGAIYRTDAVGTAVLAANLKAVEANVEELKDELSTAERQETLKQIWEGLLATDSVAAYLAKELKGTGFSNVGVQLLMFSYGVTPEWVYARKSGGPECFMWAGICTGFAGLFGDDEGDAYVIPSADHS